MEDIIKLEHLTQIIQTLQSFVGWLLERIYKEIMRAGFKAADKPLLNSMNSSLAVGMVEGMNLAAGGFTYVRQMGKEHFAADLPSFLSERQNMALLPSPLDSPHHFDNDLILHLAEEMKLQANIEVTIAMSKILPTFHLAGGSSHL